MKAPATGWPGDAGATRIGPLVPRSDGSRPSAGLGPNLRRRDDAQGAGIRDGVRAPDGHADAEGFVQGRAAR